MSQYELRWKRSALKELGKFPKITVSKLVALAELSDYVLNDGYMYTTGNPDCVHISSV